jgi:hypothetical protein
MAKERKMIESIIQEGLAEIIVVWLVLGYFISRFFRWSIKEVLEYDAVGASLFIVSMIAWPFTGIIGILCLWFVGNNSS